MSHTKRRVAGRSAAEDLRVLLSDLEERFSVEKENIRIIFA
jgi:hypothetical protein